MRCSVFSLSEEVRLKGQTVLILVLESVVLLGGGERGCWRMVIEGKCPCCGEAFSKFLLDPIHHVNVCLDRFTSSPRKGKDDEISAESSRRKGSVVVEDQDDTLTRCTHCRKDLKHLPHHLRKVHQEKCRKGDATGMGGAEVKAVPVKSTK